MSIYPVKLMEWFPHPRKRTYNSFVEAKHLHETAKFLVQLSRCVACGKHCKWNRAIGHHSIPWGSGDIWCSEYCLNNKKRTKAQFKKKPRGKRNKMLRNYVIS